MVIGFKPQFVEPILNGSKVHTFRKGKRWRAGMKIHMATGVRTENYKQFNHYFFYPELEKCISTQDYKFEFHENLKERFMSLTIDGKDMSENEIKRISYLDGFKNVTDFVNFFYQRRDKKTNTHEGQIVHWTNLKY